MTPQEIYKQLISEFKLKDLSEDDPEEMLNEVARTVHKQFLLDVYNEIGEKQFEALQSSASMGEEFYLTTIKHLVPDYQNILLGAKNKVLQAFNS